MPKNIRVVKNFTYQSIIKKAISEQPNKIATSYEIFEYITRKYPDIFKSSNSMTWKGNIRQLLSKSPQFIKISKGNGVKTNYWKYVPLEELEETEDIKRTKKYMNNKKVEANEIFNTKENYENTIKNYPREINYSGRNYPEIYSGGNTSVRQYIENSSCNKKYNMDEVSDDYYEWLDEMDAVDDEKILYPSFFDE